MLAIYKKEIKSYFTSMIGFVFMSFFLAIIGLYTVILNFVNGYSNFEYVFNSLSFVFIILVPILTMRVMAEEKKQKTDQLLYTSPVSVEKIVIGKFFAVMTLFLLSMGVTLFYPLILSQFGTVNFGAAYGGILGFTLMGATYIAIGVFISSLTESQVIAAVISFLVFLLTNLMTSIANVLPSDNVTCLLVLCGFVLIIAWVLYFMMQNVKISIAFAVIGAGGLTAAYFIKASVFDGLLSKICNSIAIVSRFDNFIIGTIDIAALCYYVSLSVLFVFLTIALVKHSFTPKRIKSGAYQTCLIVVVAAIVIVANLIVTKMNVQIDISNDGMFTLTEDTKNLVNNIPDDITIYYIVADGEQTSEIQNIIKQYDGLDGKVKVVEKDPVLYPNFTKEYTDEEVESESVIVVNDATGMSKYIPYSDMLVQEINYNTYQYETSAIDVEGQITSGISYVTADDTTKMYVVSGHGETELGSTIDSSIRKLNVEIEDLQTLTVTQIPEDCSILVLNAPTSDLTEDEAAMIKTYLENGGKAILNTTYTDASMEQYDALLAYYGVSRVKGIVVEEAGNYVGNYPSYLVPQTKTHEITDSISNYVVMAVAQGLDIATDLRSTVTVDPLLSTSDGAYSKVDVNSQQIEKEDGDIEGPFVLGAAITETFDEKETKIVTFSTSYLLDDSFLSTGQFGNDKLFLNSITWLDDMESSLSIPSRSVSQTYLSITAPQTIFWGIVLIIVIPLTLLITGLAIWMKRRKA